MCQLSALRLIHSKNLLPPNLCSMSFSANHVAFEVQKLGEDMTTGKVSHKIIMYSKHFYDLKWELSFFGVMWHVISDWLPGYRYCVLLIMECCKRTWEEERSPGKRLQGRDRKKYPRQAAGNKPWRWHGGIKGYMTWTFWIYYVLSIPSSTAAPELNEEAGSWSRVQGHGERKAPLAIQQTRP